MLVRFESLVLSATKTVVGPEAYSHCADFGRRKTEEILNGTLHVAMSKSTCIDSGSGVYAFIV